MSCSEHPVSTAVERLEQGFFLGRWRVEPRLLSVADAERTVRLEPKVMRVLVLLAARAGELVPREELRQTGWGDAYAAEEGLRRAVMLLRRIFRDDARRPQFIETIPRAGYRLIAAVVTGCQRDSDRRVGKWRRFGR